MILRSTLAALAILAAAPAWAAPIGITTPAVNAIIPATQQSTMVVTGACVANQHVKLTATDSANKITGIVWAMCTANSGYWAQINISALKDGAITIRSYQEINNVTTAVTRVVNKTLIVAPAAAVKVTFDTPAVNAVVDKSNQAALTMTGACVGNVPVKITGTDSAGKITPIVWGGCPAINRYWAQIDLSSLKDGAVSLRAYQEINGVTTEVKRSVTKKTVVVTPTPTPTPTPPAVVVGILTPAANAQVNVSNQDALEVTGSCKSENVVKLTATDSAAKLTAVVWANCESDSKFWAQINLTALANGNITLRAYQEIGGVTTNSTRVLVKNVGVVLPPSNKIVYGVNGHDGVQAAYPLSQAEARFKVLSERNLRSYRFDLVVGNTQVLDTLIPLAKKYNIILRPMIYPTSQAATYNFVKKYANDIKIWEIGNEQDHDRAGAQTRINAMVTTYKGVKQASDELGANLKTTINVMACNSDDVSATARCPKDKLGAMWFLDMAKASGFNFDHISFHYYPSYGDKGYWMDMYYSQMRAMAAKYNTKIFYNELNCGEVYRGNTDGGYKGDRGCYDSVNIFLTEITTKYSDIVAEINVYELMDEPDHPVAHEKHFGLMYDVYNPKPLLDLYTEFAKK